MQRQKPRSSRTLDANFKLPYDLTNHFRERFQPIPSLKAEYLWTQLWTKFVSMDTAPSEVRRQRAINKWLATEANNAATNERLLTVDPEFNILPRVTYSVFISRMSDTIRQVLGEVVPVSYLSYEGEDFRNAGGGTDSDYPFSDVPSSFYPSFGATAGSFSSGASTSRNRTAAHPGGKYTGKADVTARCLIYAESALAESPIWSAFRKPDEHRLVDGNVLFTVPKTAEIDRCACKEPDLNMYFQKGVGAYIRKRLRHFGIDLNDQSRNKSLARDGSEFGHLATIDLSSASDSVSYELVAQTLPVFWLSFLDDLRSPVTIIDGERHVNEMFSSMGNGFTFELESLLFYAMANAVAYFTGTPGTISVYGDDIIVPTEMCQDLISVLSFLGFETNKEKTFFEGPFRESCGGHYSNGLCITPFYIRKPIMTLRDVITLANQLRKWGGEQNGHVILDLDIEELWQWLASFVPKCYWGGYDTNDSNRLVSYWKPRNPKRLVPINKRVDTREGGYCLWLDACQGMSAGGGLETSTRSVFTGRYRSKRIYWHHGETEHVFLHELQDDVNQ